MEDLSYGISILLLLICLFTYFQTGSMTSLICFFVGAVVMASIVFSRESQQCLEDAKKEGMAALVDLAAGIGAGRNPVATGMAAVSAGQHLSAAISHLRQAEEEATRRHIEVDNSWQTTFVDRDLNYEPDRSAP